MNVRSYDVIDYLPGSAIEGAWLLLLRTHRNSARRLLLAMEDALRSGLTGCTLVVPEEGGPIEVYMVPSRLALLRVPYSAALFLVHHPTRRITVAGLIEAYGMDEAADWAGVQQEATTALDGEWDG